MIEHRSGSTQTATRDARALLRENRPADAVALVQALLAVRMGTAEDYMLLGIALAQAGDTAGAVEALEHAVVIDGGDPAAHFNLGQVYRQIGRNRDALRVFERACSLRPDYHAAITAAAELRGRSAPLSGGLTWQSPTVTPPTVPDVVAPPRVHRLTAPPPAREWNPGGWPNAIASPVAPAEPEPVPRPQGLTVLLVLTFIGATIGLVSGLIAIVTGGLLGSGGPGAAGSGSVPASGALLGLGILALVESVARLSVGWVLWQGYRWARLAMMGIIGVGILLSFVTLFQASDPYATGRGFGGLLLPLIFLTVLNQDAVKEYCTR